jgi:hypothetical protein
VDVVDRQQQRLPIRDRLEQVDDRLDNQHLELTRPERRRSFPAFSQQPRNPGTALVADTSAKPERVDQRPKRPRSFERVGIATDHGHATVSGELDHPSKQRRFPDPGLALDDRTSRGPTSDRLELTDQQLQLNIAADQPRRRPR